MRNRPILPPRHGHAGTLAMYHEHWGLRESPFRNRIDPRWFYASAVHDEGLARLHFLAEQQRRLGLLLGPPGCGKSLLLEVFALELRRLGKDVFRHSLLGLGLHEWCWQLCQAAGLSPLSTEPTFRLWRKVIDHLSANRYQRIDTLLLLDDADQADPEVLVHLGRLAQQELTPAGRLTMVLAVSDSHADRLGARLLELAELRVELVPWDAAETSNYVNTLVRRSGGERAIFTTGALVRLHELSRGLPRRINQLADMALLAAAGRGLSQVDWETVTMVHDELAVQQPSAVSTIRTPAAPADLGSTADRHDALVESPTQVESD